MNREMITLDGVPIFGKAKAIAFSEGPKERYNCADIDSSDYQRCVIMPLE